MRRCAFRMGFLGCFCDPIFTFHAPAIVSSLRAVLPLLIQVANKETGAQIEAGFKRSPVRIGRNTLNDLAIDEGFVSQWHGLVRFDADNTTYIDLGSTNGTELDGSRLDKNVEVEVGPETKLAIGPLRLTCVRVALRDDQILSRRASAFTLGGTSKQAKRIAAGGTVELGNMTADQLADTMAKSSGVSNKKELVQMAIRQRALMDEIKPLYAAFEQAKAALDAVIERGMNDATPTEKPTRAQLLEAQFPKAFETAQTRATAGLEPTGSDVPAWFERLAPGSSGEWESPIAQMERAGAVLETFAAALIDLEAGQSQIRKDLSLEPKAESSGLPTFTDSRDLLRYLFDASVDGRDRIDELSRSFADIAMHQLGLIAGAQDGARALWSAISPHAIGAVARGALAKTSMGFGDVIWPFSAAGHYYKYVSRHLELGSGDKANEHLFGAAFARAYYRITGRRG